jgi:Tetracyclin repressor-like, C-terminal domain
VNEQRRERDPAEQRETDREQRLAAEAVADGTCGQEQEDLFLQVMTLPPAVAAGLERLADGPRETVGRRLAELVVGALENPVSRAVVLGRIRCATTHPDAAALVRETVTRDLGALAAALTDDRPDTRAVLVGVQVVGVALARYVVLVEPLASMRPSDVIELVAPTFQHYLVEPLTIGPN